MSTGDKHDQRAKEQWLRGNLKRHEMDKAFTIWHYRHIEPLKERIEVLEFVCLPFWQRWWLVLKAWWKERSGDTN